MYNESTTADEGLIEIFSEVVAIFQEGLRFLR